MGRTLKTDLDIRGWKEFQSRFYQLLLIVLLEFIQYLRLSRFYQKRFNAGQLHEFECTVYRIFLKENTEEGWFKKGCVNFSLLLLSSQHTHL